MKTCFGDFLLVQNCMAEVDIIVTTKDRNPFEAKIEFHQKFIVMLKVGSNSLWCSLSFWYCQFQGLAAILTEYRNILIFEVVSCHGDKQHYNMFVKFIYNPLKLPFLSTWALIRWQNRHGITSVGRIGSLLVTDNQESIWTLAIINKVTKNKCFFILYKNIFVNNISISSMNLASLLFWQLVRTLDEMLVD